MGPFKLTSGSMPLSFPEKEMLRRTAEELSIPLSALLRALMRIGLRTFKMRGGTVAGVGQDLKSTGQRILDNVEACRSGYNTEADQQVDDRMHAHQAEAEPAPTPQNGGRTRRPRPR